jgi:hypothetical protein
LAAQKKNLTALSRAQTRDEATRRKLEAESRELDRCFAEAREDLDRSAERLAKHYAWSARYGHWLARVALLPVLALAIGMVFVVASGLWNGEIKELQKYSKLYVTRSASPIAYWASVVYHSALATFTTWIALYVFRCAKIFRKNPKS